MEGLTLIARCDSGGLGSQTQALYEFLQPENTVVIHSSPSRGLERPERFPRGGVVHVDEKAITAAFLRGVTQPGGTLLSCETFYTDTAPLEGWCRRVLVANPELYDWRYAADVVVVPTPWELQRMPEGTEVLPHPQRKGKPGNRKLRTGPVNTFFHIAAPAMMDRCGYQTVLQAAALMQEECEILIHGGGRQHPSEARWPEGPNVHIHWSDKDHSDWDDLYPTEAQVLILPRRYGGLCLPTQEAAELGMPNIMPDLWPQVDWPGMRTKVLSATPTQMKGGTFDVFYPSPMNLAMQMNELVRGEHDLERMSLDAMAWAESLHWENLKPQWEEVLQCG